MTSKNVDWPTVTVTVTPGHGHQNFMKKLWKKKSSDEDAVWLGRR
jgi:hypothetical protein